MFNIDLPKDELLKMVSKNVNILMEENRDNFNANNQVMTPMSSQIAVLATIKTLHDLGIININEPEKK